MTVQVRKLFAPGLQIPYEYDFGTTSELVIKVVGERQGKPTTKNPIVLMARNKFQPPPCAECGQPAEWVCVECVWEDDSSPMFCQEHADEHEHDEMLIPLSTRRAPACAATPARLSRRTRLLMLLQELQA